MRAFRWARTALSHPKQGNPPSRRSIGLARSSQATLLVLALCALGPAGCLVAETPDYGPARQTAPVVEPLTISPTPSYQFDVDYVQSRTLTLFARSEDNGEELTAAIWVDYVPSDGSGDAGPNEREQYIEDFNVAPRPFDQPKQVSFPFKPTPAQVPPGCHTLSVLLMHRSSYDSVSNKPIQGAYENDVTVVTWFFFAHDDTNPGPYDPSAPPARDHDDLDRHGEL